MKKWLATTISLLSFVTLSAFADSSGPAVVSTDNQLRFDARKYKDNSRDIAAVIKASKAYKNIKTTFEIKAERGERTQVATGLCSLTSAVCGVVGIPALFFPATAPVGWALIQIGVASLAASKQLEYLDYTNSYFELTGYDNSNNPILIHVNALTLPTAFELSGRIKGDLELTQK